MEYLGYLLQIIGLVCWIMVLIPMFKESPLHGILGIVTCGLWALIRGWMKAKDYKVEKVMIIWTVTIVLWFLLIGIAVMAAIGDAG